MEGTLAERLFREPDSDTTGPLLVGVASFLFATFLYYRIVHDHTATSNLIAGSVFLVTGAPEFLPSSKRTLAGIGRIIAVCYSLAIVGYSFFLY